MNFDAFSKWCSARGYLRARLTLDQAMEILGATWIEGALPPHITFDPKVDHQYRIIRSHSHDGTTMFTRDLLSGCMRRLFNRTTHFKPMGPPPENHLPYYTIGNIRHAMVFGKVNLPAGRYPGCRESFVIPVRCEYRPVGFPICAEAVQ